MKSGLKIAALSLVLIFSVGYLWSAWTQSTDGLRGQVSEEELNGGDSFRPPRGERPERPSREDMEKRFREELDLTDEQAKKLEEIREKYRNQGGEGEDRRGNWRDMQNEVNEVLSDEQQEKMRNMFQQGREEMRGRMQQMMQQREQEAQEALSPEEFERWKEKRDERIQQWRDRASQWREGRGRGGDRGGDNNDGGNDEQRR